MSDNIQHNKNNNAHFSEYMKRKKAIQNSNEIELRKARIRENLKVWDKNFSKLKEVINIDKQNALMIRNAHPLRVAFVGKDPRENYRKAYKLARFYISLGMSPSEVLITNLNDCYLSVRGFGEKASIKESIFSPKVKLLLIEEVRENRKTDIADNATTFVNELASALDIRQDLCVIFVGNSESSYKFFNINYNDNYKYLKEIDIAIVSDDKRRKFKKVFSEEVNERLSNF